jgi:hypothetical protein
MFSSVGVGGALGEPFLLGRRAETESFERTDAFRLCIGDAEKDPRRSGGDMSERPSLVSGSPSDRPPELATEALYS